MTEFHAQLRARALDAVNDLTAAQESGDDFSVDVHRADLEYIARIAREHGRVDAVATDRLQGQLGGEIWLLDGVEDAALTALGAVLGKTATGLSHEPHRYAIVRVTLATCGHEQRHIRRQPTHP